MIVFMFAFLCVQMAAWVFGTFDGQRNMAFLGSGTTPRDFFLPMVLLPTAAAWITAEAAALARTPRLLGAPVQSSQAGAAVLRLAMGAGVGVLHVLIAGVALALVQERMSDLWVMPIAAAVAMGAVVLALPGQRRGGCTTCGYDWSGLSRCPECGTLHASAGVAAQ